MRNIIWNVGRKWVLGTALVAGLLGTSAVAANAAPQEFRGRPEQRFNGRFDGRNDGRFNGGFNRGYGREYGRGYGRPGFGVVVGAPVDEGYIPPCPGDGYAWIGGAWVFRGGYGGGYRGYESRGYENRGYGYGQVARFDRGREAGRGFERGSGRGFDHGDRGRR